MMLTKIDVFIKIVIIIIIINILIIIIIIIIIIITSITHSALCESYSLSIVAW